MRQFLSQSHRILAPLEGLSRIAAKPQRPGAVVQAGDAGVLPVDKSQ